MHESFTIDKVAWHIAVEGNPESQTDIIERFWNIVDFLQSNNLTLNLLANSREDIDNDFSIKTIDLNENGLRIMKLGYDKWLSKVDRGMSSNDMTLLIKLLGDEKR